MDSSHFQRLLTGSLLGTSDSTHISRASTGPLVTWPPLWPQISQLTLSQNLEGPDHIPKALALAFSLFARDHGARPWICCAEPRPQGATSLVLSTYQPSSFGPRRAPCSHHSQGPSPGLLKSLLSLHQSPEHQMGPHSPLGLPTGRRQRKHGSDKDRLAALLPVAAMGLPSFLLIFYHVLMS